MGSLRYNKIVSKFGLENEDKMLAEQLEFADCGGWVEKCTLALHPDWGNMPVAEFVVSEARGLEVQP